MIAFALPQNKRLSNIVLGVLLLMKVDGFVDEGWRSETNIDMGGLHNNAAVVFLL
jgi:hypothetical protein